MATVLSTLTMRCPARLRGADTCSKCVNVLKAPTYRCREDATRCGQVRNHFGEEISLYIAFMNFYNRKLFLPALIGVVLFVLCLVLPGSLAANWPPYIAPLYAISMVTWTAIMQARGGHAQE